MQDDDDDWSRYQPPDFARALATMDEFSRARWRRPMPDDQRLAMLGRALKRLGDVVQGDEVERVANAHEAERKAKGECNAR